MSAATPASPALADDRLDALIPDMPAISDHPVSSPHSAGFDDSFTSSHSPKAATRIHATGVSAVKAVAEARAAGLLSVHHSPIGSGAAVSAANAIAGVSPAPSLAAVAAGVARSPSLVAAGGASPPPAPRPAVVIPAGAPRAEWDEFVATTFGAVESDLEGMRKVIERYLTVGEQLEKTTPHDDRSGLVAGAVALNVDALAIIARLNRRFQDIIGGNRTTQARRSVFSLTRCQFTRKMVQEYDDAFRGLSAISAGFTRVIRDGEETNWKVEIASANPTASANAAAVDAKIQALLVAPTESITPLFATDGWLKSLEPAVRHSLIAKHNDSLNLVRQQSELARLFTDEQVLVEASSEPNDPPPLSAAAGGARGASASPVTPSRSAVPASSGGDATLDTSGISVAALDVVDEDPSAYEHRNALRAALVANARRRNRICYGSMIAIIVILIIVIAVVASR